jgi:hypothetical protein
MQVAICATWRSVRERLSGKGVSGSSPSASAIASGMNCSSVRAEVLDERGLDEGARAGIELRP